MSVLFPSPLTWENYPSHSLEHQNMHCTIFNWSQVRLNHDCTYQSYLPSLWVSVDSKLTCRYCIKTDGHTSTAIMGFFMVGWKSAHKPSDPLSPGQAIATFQCNVSQHCWVQHVAYVWLPCCDVLRCVATCLVLLAQIWKWSHFSCNICGCCMML